MANLENSSESDSKHAPCSGDCNLEANSVTGSNPERAFKPKYAISLFGGPENQDTSDEMIATQQNLALKYHRRALGLDKKKTK